MIVEFELIERLLLVGPDDIGDVLRGVEVAHPRTRMLRKNKVADRVNQVGLSQTYAAVDEQRVVRCAGVFGDLQCGRARELIGFPGDKAIEAEFWNEARALRVRRSSCGSARGAGRRRSRLDG